MSPRTLILDTNVFYNLGAGTLRREDIGAPGDVLAVSPISILEIAGKLTSRTFLERKAAAQAILSHAKKELPDPDTHLTRDIFGYVPDYAPMSFEHGVKAMAQSTDVRSLVAGVADLTEQVVRRVSVPKVHGWRLITEGKWVKDLTKIQRNTIPKFAKWERGSRKKAVPRLKGQARERFLADTKTNEWMSTLPAACQSRAFLCAKTDKIGIPDKETARVLAGAIMKVGCYCAVYTRYLVWLLTEGGLPTPNDSGDIELFLYATDDSMVVVTSEKKWTRFATEAGFESRVLLV